MEILYFVWEVGWSIDKLLFKITLLDNYGVHSMSEEFIHHHCGQMGWDKVSFGLHPTHLVPTLDTFLHELQLIPEFTYFTSLEKDGLP